jgi:hypothetical protein
MATKERRHSVGVQPHAAPEGKLTKHVVMLTDARERLTGIKIQCSAAATFQHCKYIRYGLNLQGTCGGCYWLIEDDHISHVLYQLESWHL